MSTPQQITDLVDEQTGEVSAEAEIANELARTGQRSQIYVSAMVAKRFPRDEKKCMDDVLSVCELPEFAGKFDQLEKPSAYYSFPRGGAQITGPSIKLAKEIQRSFGNIWTGFVVTLDDDDRRGVLAYAWDADRNNHRDASDVFKKLIYRKGEGMKTPDERDLRELTNKCASILVRNCILSLVPEWFVDACIDRAKKTVAASATPANRKEHAGAMVKAFSGFGIDQKQLEHYVGCPLSRITSEQLTDLRGVYEALRDGQLTPENRVEMFGRTGNGSPKKQGVKKSGRRVKVKAAEDQTDPYAKHTEKPAEKDVTEIAVSTAISLIEEMTLETTVEVRKELRKLYKQMKNPSQVMDAFNAKLSSLKNS